MPSFLSGKKFIGVVLLLVMFIFAGFTFFEDDTTPESRMPEQTEIVFDEKGTQLEKADIIEDLKENPKAQTTELTPVDGSNSSGIAYVLTESDSTLHAIVAELPDPPEGSVYEGWLVRPEPLNFFSTGLMSKNNEGQWLLRYERTGDFPAHKRVVITEEKELDGVPEKHVLEGEF